MQGEGCFGGPGVHGMQGFDFFKMSFRISFPKKEISPNLIENRTRATRR